MNAAGPRPLPVPASLVRAFHSGHFLAYLGTYDLANGICTHVDSVVDLDPDWIRISWGSLDSYPDPDSHSGSGSKRGKNDPEN